MSKYKLEIDLNVLNHLGLNLYSNVSAVLSEIIANAWDADATRVDISIESSERIIIKDNGCGMDEDDLQDKFLTVGHERRKKEDESTDQTPKMKRLVMGRKGIGKLSTFSIAETVQIITKKKDSKILAIELDVKEIQKKIDDKKIYHPHVITPPKTNIGDSGTVIILSNLKKRILASLNKQLRQRIARRFSVFSDSFQVMIDDKEVTLSDRNYFKNLECSLVYGNYDKSNFHNKTKLVSEKGEIKEGHIVHGWIGLVENSKTLQDGGDNINKISVIVRGKVAQEDILSSFRDGGLYTKYVIGELEADFLDSTNENDIATSSRENFIGNDERLSVFLKFVRQELRHLQRQREKIKSRKGLEKAQEIPAVKKWYEKLRGSTKDAAKRLFGEINTIAVDDKHRKTLLKYSVLAFTHLRYKELLDKLDLLNAKDLATIKLFSELNDIEANWYHQITKGRLDIIKKLSDCISENAIEKTIQEHIYEHLWLLDPSWDRATETPRLEETITKSFKEISNKLTDAEKKLRIDIRYKKTSGQHIIIELKRSSVNIDGWNLIEQVRKYKRVLRKQLNLANEHGTVEAICLVGKLPRWDSPEERKEGEDTLEKNNIRIITYQQLIKDAEVSYKLYLEKNKERGEIQKLLNSIDEFNYDAPE